MNTTNKQISNNPISNIQFPIIWNWYLFDICSIGLFPTGRRACGTKG